MKPSEMFPSKWSKASDFASPILATIRNITSETVGDKNKWVLNFVGDKPKPLVLNMTNTSILESLYGSETTDDWCGKPIVIFSEKVQFQGKMVDGIRLRAPKKTVALVEPPTAETDDDVPF